MLCIILPFLCVVFRKKKKKTGRGGRVAAHGGTLSSFIVKNIALDKTDDSNPREAILRHAKEAAENPYWVAPAYKT